MHHQLHLLARHMLRAVHLDLAQVEPSADATPAPARPTPHDAARLPTGSSGSGAPARLRHPTRASSRIVSTSWSKLHPCRARRHRHQAVVGHARRGIDFQKIRLARCIQHHIQARPATAAEHLERLQRQCLRWPVPRAARQTARARGIRCRRADIWLRNRRNAFFGTSRSSACPARRESRRCIRRRR